MGLGFYGIRAGVGFRVIRLQGLWAKVLGFRV